MKTTILKEEIKEGRLDSTILDVYLDEKMLDYNRDRYVKAIEKYEELYGEDDVTILSVPGRSEVGGNHTDHQHGKVLACSLNLDIIAVASKNNYVSLVSDGRQVKGISLKDLSAQPTDKHSTRGLVKGVLAKLQSEGYRIGGFKAYLTSDVLVGSGMSSSAAFEVMIGNIINALYNNFRIDPIELAKFGQYAENVYFGKPCGLMDQMACSVGGLVNIDFADTANPIVKKVNVDFSKFGYSLCIVDTKGSHSSLTDDYAAITDELKEVCDYFGKEVLREVDYQQVIDNIDSLRESCGDRAVLRALHVYEENKRVDAQVAALEAGEFAEFLQLIKASGDSSFKYLQNVYTNKDVENQSVSIGLMMSEIILADNGVCRVHGGGFAGTIQAFVKNEFVETYKSEIEKVFGENSCHVLKVRKYGGKVIVG